MSAVIATANCIHNFDEVNHTRAKERGSERMVFVGEGPGLKGAARGLRLSDGRVS